MRNHATPPPTDEPAGFNKSGPGCWVMNDADGGRFGLVLRYGPRWHAECDQGCDIYQESLGSREHAERVLRDHWSAASQPAVHVPNTDAASRDIGPKESP